MSHESISREGQQFTNLKKRLLKWDLVLNEIHEDLKYLHQEFDIFYNAMNKMEGTNESVDG